MEDLLLNLFFATGLECIGEQVLALNYEQKQCLRAVTIDGFVWLPTDFDKSIELFES